MLSVSSPGVTLTVHMEVSVVLGMSAGGCVSIFIVKYQILVASCSAGVLYGVELKTIHRFFTITEKAPTTPPPFTFKTLC